MNKSLILVLAVAAISCNNPINKQTDNEYKSNKKVVEPNKNKVYALPAELNEISGISFLNDSIVVAIQDEDGILYYYDLKQNRIIKKQRFAKTGDYEDLVRVDKDMYIVVSSGLVYQIKNFESDKPVIKTFQTPLNNKNDIEGLAYEPKNNRLLLAAKNNGLDKNDTTKEIYAFDLKTMLFHTTPAYTINANEIEEYFKGDAIEESSKKFLKALGNENINKIFRSSALTINPVTNELYVLSSINNMIAVLSPEGKITTIIRLKGKDFKQPEGIAFSPQGRLYISNDGQGGIGNIIRLTYEK